LLTGPNGGIGRGIAMLFGAHGANLVLTDLDAAGLAAFSESLPRAGRDVSV
jgi:3-oxoacyl-[acyl-carrier protein] reductase